MSPASSDDAAKNPSGSPPSGASAGTVTARVQLTIGGRTMRGELAVPNRPATARDLLPLMWSLSGVVVSMAVSDARGAGKSVSCRSGCGACCRKLVPLAAIEARQLRDLVENFPEPRRSHVRRRFAEAQQAMASAGLLEKMMHPERLGPTELSDLLIRYWNQRVPCPFLEEESCSIYEQRPLICREYLVSSPAEHCAAPETNPIDRMVLPASLADAAMWFDSASAAPPVRWVPLVIAPLWADEHPDASAARPGIELVEEFLQFVMRQENARPAGETQVCGPSVS